MRSCKDTLSLALAAVSVALAVIGGAVLITILVSIVVPPSEEQVSIQKGEIEVVCEHGLGGIVSVMHDNKRNVTCWCYRGGQRGGISCIPDHMLTP